MNRSSLISPCTQHKVVLLVVLTMFAVGFLFSDYFVSCNKAFGRNIPSSRRQSVGTLPLFVRQLSPGFCAASSTVTIAFKLADVKLESSEAYLLKLGKNLSWDFEVINIFRKDAVLNICRYLKGFYIYKKINKIFLKFHYYSLRMLKIIEIG